MKIDKLDRCDVQNSLCAETQLLPHFLENCYGNLPIHNDYMGPDGGYVAIYTREQDRAVYGVGGDIYVMGAIRVQGRYHGRIFVPKGYALGDNITRDKAILALCEKHYPDMKGKMWIGGDTGGWFGYPL